MKRLYNILVGMLLILAVAAGIGWIYSLKHEGSYIWSHHVRPFFDEQTDGVTGCSMNSYWSVSWQHGRITLDNQYLVDSDTIGGYQSPPGFPMDDHLAERYKRIWSQSIEEQDSALQHRGFGTADLDACDVNTWWGRRGFGRENSRILPPYPQNFSGGAGRLAYTVPAWAIIFPLLILPAFKLRTLIRRQRRIAAGRCVRCGYDLRASSGRCPECGTVVELAKSAA